MIEEKIVYRCRSCESENIVRNGHSRNGKQQYICKACGRSGVVNPEEKYSEQEKTKILNAYFERPSMRGIQRIFGVSRPTLAEWLKKSLPWACDRRHVAACQRRRCSGTWWSLVVCTQAIEQALALDRFEPAHQAGSGLLHWRSQRGQLWIALEENTRELSTTAYL